jgi:hypothetical protein
LVGRLIYDQTWRELHQRLGLPLRHLHAIAEKGARQLLSDGDVAFADTPQHPVNS